jgi:hypothetical protein
MNPNDSVGVRQSFIVDLLEVFLRPVTKAVTRVNYIITYLHVCIFEFEVSGISDQALNLLLSLSIGCALWKFSLEPRLK